MRYRGMVAASAAAAAAMAGIAVVAAQRLPAGTQLATHWGPDGAADRFADAGTALAMPVALTIGLSLLMAALPRLEPLQDRLSRSAPLYRTAWGGLLALILFVELVIAAPAFGVTPPPATMLVAVGLLLVVIGNALPKSRPGFFVGIRTPWTLTDPDNWVATHRLGSRTMIAGGLIVVALALAPIAGDVRAPLIMAAVLIAALVPVAYSFLYWRRHRTG